jgi:NAD(P)-dependent dehydrogenase (short-subunit alcohol dehydrogenase family)
MTDGAVVVVGGSSGLGLEVARHYADAGRRVVVTSRAADRATDAAAQVEYWNAPYLEGDDDEAKSERASLRCARRARSLASRASALARSLTRSREQENGHAPTALQLLDRRRAHRRH